MTRTASRLEPRALWRRWVPSLAILVIGAACAEEAPQPTSDPTDPPREPEEISVVPAEYATEIAFVGFASEPLRLYARFVNKTTESELERDYGGWFESDGSWHRLEGLRDRLPVPRASWRVLPGGAWRVLAADGGELAGLVYRDTLMEFRLSPGTLVAEWTGETGQREALLLARIQQGDSAQAGLLVLRRSARVRNAGEAAAASRTQLFLLVDSLSNGLLVARDAADPDSTAIAWTWVGSIGNEWTDVRIRPPPENVSTALARWVVELPEAGVTARFRLEDLPDDSESWLGPKPFALSGQLEILGRRRPAAGLGVESRG